MCFTYISVRKLFMIEVCVITAMYYCMKFIFQYIILLTWMIPLNATFLHNVHCITWKKKYRDWKREDNMACHTNTPKMGNSLSDSSSTYVLTMICTKKDHYCSTTGANWVYLSCYCYAIHYCIFCSRLIMLWLYYKAYTVNSL